MNAASLDRLRTAGALQACTRRVAKAALEYEMACDACQGLALEVAEWSREDGCAGLVPAFRTMKRSIAGARDFARDLCRGASCIADAVAHETLKAMTPEEREEFGDAVIRVMSREAFERLNEEDRRFVVEKRRELGLSLDFLPDGPEMRPGGEAHA